MTIRILLLGSAACMMSVSAMAQEANIEGRVGKLEKEMRAVQRQVFPNGAGKFLEPEIQSPTAQKPTTSSSTATADLLVRVDALETQLATLTGQFEQHDNAMRQMEVRLKAIEAQLKTQADQAAAGTASVAPVATTPAPTIVATPAAAKPKPATPAPAVAAKPTAARTAAVAAIEKPATGDAVEEG